VDGEAKTETVEDAAERDAREKRQREAGIKRELARRSAVVQRSLPRLPIIDVNRLMESFSREEPNELESRAITGDISAWEYALVI